MPSHPLADAYCAYRRKLPHWRLEGGVYFLTWRLREQQAELNPSERELIVSILLHFHGTRYRLHGYVVMNDHVHVIVEPIAGFELKTITHSWKSFTANQLQRRFARKGSIWQEECFDRIVRDEVEYLEKAQYIHDNPFNRWPEIADYPWLGFPQWQAGAEANKR